MGTRKDVSPGGKAAAGRASQTMTRGNSVPRRAEGQSEMLDKVRRVEDAMGKFKSSLLKREQLVGTLVAAMAEGNKTTLRMIDSWDQEQTASDSGKHRCLQPHVKDLSEDETDTRPVLHKRIQELQQQNNDLLAELRTANKKLMDAKFERDRMQPAHETEPVVAWKTVPQNFFPQGRARGHSQPRDDTRELEKECHELRARVQVLSRELEKTSQTEDEKLVEYVPPKRPGK